MLNRRRGIRGRRGAAWAWLIAALVLTLTESCSTGDCSPSLSTGNHANCPDSGALPDGGHSGTGVESGSETADTGNEGSETGDSGVPMMNTVCGDGSAPFRRIQDAIDAASDGDVISVCAGNYSEELTVADVAVSLRGSEGADATVVSAPGTGPALSITSGQGEDTEVSGLTLMGGGSAMVYGGGLHVEGSSPRLSALIIRDNLAGNGGGMALLDSNAVVDGVTFSANQAIGVGGAIYINGESSPVLRHLWVEGNTSAFAATLAQVSRGNVSLSNSVFVGNMDARDGGTLLVSSGDAIVTNCGFANNTYEEGTEQHVIVASVGAYLNNIFYDNGGSAATCRADSTTVEYSLGWGNASASFSAECGVTNLELDPLFSAPVALGPHSSGL